MNQTNPELMNQMNHEPAVDFDMDEVERRIDGVMPESSRDREIAEQAVRAFASMVIPYRSVRLGSKEARAMCLRMAVAVYLLRIPGHEAFRSLADIAERYGVSRERASRVAMGIKRNAGLPDRITRTYRHRSG